MQIARVDERTRTLWFGANGREKAQDPYFLHFYRTGLDGKATVSLTPDDGTHAMQLSPSGKYLIDTYSKPDVPPAVTLRDAAGRLVMPLERADISKLLATGWKPPTPIRMTAADGKTDIYGLMFTPTNLDQAKTTRSSTTSTRAHRPEAPAAVPSRPHAAIVRRSPSSASSSSRSTDAARPAGQRRFRTRTTARWAATTPFPIRLRG